MGKYYIKKLGSQELGYRKGSPGGGGRYIYISKQCADFFPHLSTTVNNDTVLIPIVPPFSDSKVYTSLVYHNDRYNRPDGTRDEYRLYLNKDIDLHRDYYKPEDIIIFDQINQKEEGELVPLYFLYRIEPSNPHYETLESIIDSSPIRGGHAIIEADFSFIPKRTFFPEEIKVIVPDEVKKEVTEKQKVLTETQPIEEIRGAQLFNSVSFRDFVLLGYGYKCAITEKSILWKQLNNLEAAHIRPKAHTGSYLPCNGIALSRDMHWAFDKGFLTISEEYKVIVHEEVKESMLKDFNGKSIILPLDPFFQPDKNYLKYHRENIFGLFKYSGSIRSII